MFNIKNKDNYILAFFRTADLLFCNNTPIYMPRLKYFASALVFLLRNIATGFGIINNY